MIRLFHLVTAALGAMLLVLLAASAPATAQQRREAVPAVLNQVLLVSEGPTESKFRLSLSPRNNTFGKVGDDPAQPAIGLALTTRGAGAVTPPGLAGLVRSITFDQVESILILRFGTSLPATAKAIVVSDTTIEVTVTSGVRAAQVRSETTLASGPVPQAYVAPPGEDGYELVMLKYADVSEVVGILTDGLTVKSNDTFIPREPSFGSNSLTGSAYNPGPSNYQGQNNNDQNRKSGALEEPAHAESASVAPGFGPSARLHRPFHSFNAATYGRLR